MMLRIAYLHHQVGGFPASSSPEGFILLTSKLLFGSDPCAVKGCGPVELSLRRLSKFFRIDLIDRSDGISQRTA